MPVLSCVKVKNGLCQINHLDYLWEVLSRPCPDFSSGPRPRCWVFSPPPPENSGKRIRRITCSGLVNTNEKKTKPEVYFRKLHVVIQGLKTTTNKTAPAREKEGVGIPPGLRVLDCSCYTVGVCSVIISRFEAQS